MSGGEVQDDWHAIVFSFPLNWGTLVYWLWFGNWEWSEHCSSWEPLYACDLWGCMGRCGSGGKSCRLAVGGLPVRSHPGRVEVSLSKTPNPQLLLASWLVPCMAANRRWCVNVCVNGWMRGINCTALWIKALYKCSPFTIYHLGESLQDALLSLMHTFKGGSRKKRTWKL